MSSVVTTVRHCVGRPVGSRSTRPQSYYLTAPYVGRLATDRPVEPTPGLFSCCYSNLDAIAASHWLGRGQDQPPGRARPRHSICCLLRASARRDGLPHIWASSRRDLLSWSETAAAYTPKSVHHGAESSWVLIRASSLALQDSGGDSRKPESSTRGGGSAATVQAAARTQLDLQGLPGARLTVTRATLIIRPFERLHDNPAARGGSRADITQLTGDYRR